MQTNTIGYLQGNASELIHSCALALSKQEWWIKHRTSATAFCRSRSRGTSRTPLAGRVP